MRSTNLGSLRARHVVLGLSLAALASLGPACGIPAPSYPELADEKQATFEPGFDPTDGQIGRWICDDFDLVRVRGATFGDVLVEMNRDYVMKPIQTIAGAGTQFGFADSLGMRVSFLVPDDVTRPIGVIARAASGNVEQHCVPTGGVRVYR